MKGGAARSRGRLARGARRLAHIAWLKARHRESLRILAEMERSQWLSPEAIRALQERRLEALLRHAGTRVPFYRAAFRKAGIDPSAPGGSGALAALPVVTKDMIRERGAEFLSEDAGSLGAAANQTGGSTGVPLVFHQDRTYREHRYAAMLRGFRWCGWSLGGPLAYLWGSDIDSKAHRGRGAVRDALLGISWFDAFYLEERAIDGILDRLAAEDPEILIGYTSTVRHVARHALARGRPLALRAVETSAELLTPDARRDIEAAFGCKVYDRYGCREAGVVAHQCGAGEGWHVSAETAWVEVDPEGRLLLTPLMNRAMPLIRYRNEDVVDLGGAGCPCGRGLPRITRVVGRRTDIIRSPGGRAIHGEFFTHLFYGVPGIREFQVVQKTLSDLLVRVAADDAFTAAHRARIEAAIVAHGDAGFRVAWERVATIPRGPSGKHRFTLSELADREEAGAESPR